jgi:hypothetical protein
MILSFYYLLSACQYHFFRIKIHRLLMDRLMMIWESHPIRRYDVLVFITTIVLQIMSGITHYPTQPVNLVSIRPLLITSEPLTIRFYAPTLVRFVVGILKPTLPMGLSRWKPPTTLVPRDMISISSPCCFKAATGCIINVVRTRSPIDWYYYPTYSPVGKQL